MEGTLRRRIGKGCVVAAAAALTAGILPSPGSFPPAYSRPVPAFTAGPRLYQAALRAQGVPVADRTVALLLTGDPDPAALAARGVVLRTRAGDVWTAHAPLAAVTRLGDVPGLRAAALAARLHPLLDVALAETGVTGVREHAGAAWSGLTGRNVLVGIVDSGLDVTHDDFRRPDGTTRVVAYWDQTAATGDPPPGRDYGSFWSAADIDGGAELPGDPTGHGTHVASIAAGNGRAGGEDLRYAGAAPEADIAVVATAGYEDAVIDAVAYLFDLAAGRGQACVVNLSLGTHLGAHDGAGPLETALDALTGPGRIITAAAGNDGDRGIHAELSPGPGAADSARCVVTAQPADAGFVYFDIEAWYTAPEGMDITVVTPSGKRFGPYPEGAVEPDRLTGEGTLFVYHAEAEPGDVRRRVFLEISNTVPAGGGPAAPPAPGTWRVVAHNPGTAPAELDLWVAGAYPADAVTASWHSDDRDPTEEVAIPGTAAGVITVGAYNTRRCWEGPVSTQCSTLPDVLTEPGAMSWFSSAGPTRDGRQKPELGAPGFVIAAARSHQIDPGHAAAVGLPGTGLAGGEYLVRAGTSGSAPHVAGVLALALQVRPTLDPGEARAQLVATARRDAWTGEGWDPRAGFGKLDAEAFLGVVPVGEQRFQVATTVTGRPELRWEAAPQSGVAGFTILARAPGAAWSLRARLDGPGPHRWVDPDAAGPVVYRLEAVGRDGRTASWGEQSWTPPAPSRLRAFPNPFRDAARLVPAGLDPATPVAVRIRDATGREVRSWTGAAGRLEWDGRDAAGRPVAAGVYWAAVEAAGERRTARLVRLP